MMVGIMVDIKWTHNMTQILNGDILKKGKNVKGHIHIPKTKDDIRM